MDPLSSGALQFLKKCSLYTDSDFFKQKIITEKNLSFYNECFSGKTGKGSAPSLKKIPPFGSSPLASGILEPPTPDTVYDIK